MPNRKLQILLKTTLLEQVKLNLVLPLITYSSVSELASSK